MSSARVAKRESSGSGATHWCRRVWSVLRTTPEMARAQNAAVSRATDDRRTGYPFRRLSPALWAGRRARVLGL